MCNFAFSPPDCDDKWRIVNQFNGKTSIPSRDQRWLYSNSPRSLPMRRGDYFTSNFILTAAHCFESSSDSAIYVVRVGTHDSTWWGSVYEVHQLLIHPNYTYHPLRNDIGILELKTSLEFGKGIQSIAMVDLEFLKYVPLITNASGYGTEVVNGSALGYLKEVQLGTISMNNCSRFYDGLLKNQICANTLTWRNETGR